MSAQLHILNDNPYAGHPDLSPLQAEVLWEYAKTSALVKQLATTTRNLANEPANDLLAKLRSVESQMGLVLTLYKASVWSTIVTAEEQQQQLAGDESGDWDESASADMPRGGRRGGPPKSFIPRPSSAGGHAAYEESMSREEGDSYDSQDYAPHGTRYR